MKPEITPYDATYRKQVIDLSIDAWTPVIAKTEHEVPGFVFEAFYPDGWLRRHTKDVTDLLDKEPENIWLAFSGEELAGFIGLRNHPEDQMGEIYIIAVAPSHQRQGIGRHLMGFAGDLFRDRGMKMMMVETIGDEGHAPARRAYEAFGFQPWPVARYFKEL
ncbi:MAG: GNAT family N-acetyltransferase [Pseudomonadota bacterium]